MRRGLVDSVERLRKAPRNEIPSILEVLRRQAADLAQVQVSRNNCSVMFLLLVMKLLLPWKENGLAHLVTRACT